MKRKPFNKKLALRKQTVARLDSNSLTSLKGGSSVSETICVDEPKTYKCVFGGFDFHRQFNTDCLYASKNCHVSQFTTSITATSEIEFTFTRSH